MILCLNFTPHWIPWTQISHWCAILLWHLESKLEMHLGANRLILTEIVKFLIFLMSTRHSPSFLGYDLPFLFWRKSALKYMLRKDLLKSYNRSSWGFAGLWANVTLERSWRLDVWVVDWGFPSSIPVLLLSHESWCNCWRLSSSVTVLCRWE